MYNTIQAPPSPNITVNNITVNRPPVPPAPASSPSPIPSSSPKEKNFVMRNIDAAIEFPYTLFHQKAILKIIRFLVE